MRPGWLLRVGLPAYVVGLFLFLALPMIIVVAVSFNAGEFVHFPPRGFSVRWFRHVFESGSFGPAIVNSFKLAILSTLGSLLLGIPAALALVRYPLPFRDAIQSFLLSPLSLPLIVFGVALLFFAGAIGLQLSFIGLLAGHIVITVPYVLRTVVGVYSAVDRHLEEAAMVLGADGLTCFRRVTLPMIKPGIVVGSIFSFLTSFDNVPVSIFMTKTDTMTLPVAILSYLVYSFDPSVAAVSTLQMLFAITVLLLVERVYGLGSFSGMAGQ
ncbi:MAG: ABC transporter permease [Candidatus Rokuibacteriota bacterium]